MKKIALAAAFSMAATSSFAGGHMSKYDEPVVEPEVIVEDTRGTAAGIVVPIMLLVVLAAVAASR